MVRTFLLSVNFFSTLELIFVWFPFFFWWFSSKTAAKMAVARIKLLRNKREAVVRQMRRDIALLLQSKQDATARIRVLVVFVNGDWKFWSFLLIWHKLKDYLNVYSLLFHCSATTCWFSLSIKGYESYC